VIKGVAEMTKLVYFPPMLNTRKIAILVYPGCQLLDATGPATVFMTANSSVGRNAYAVELFSANGGLVRTDSGIEVASNPLPQHPSRRLDTLIVAGGDEAALQTAFKAGRLVPWINRHHHRFRRVGSVCTGSFLLAAASVLDGRRAATHWAACSALQRLYPSISVDAEALFAVDGNIWTSAGVTTGLDMALEMVEQDHSADAANAVAQTLVLYARRPGHQSQFSPLLKAQEKAGSVFGELIAWMNDNISQPLGVPALAARAGMTERTFFRRFTSSVGVSPARFVETLRLDAARSLLDQGEKPKAVAAALGFRSTAQMSLAFERRFGLRPSLLRKLHRPSAQSSTKQ
jgi:transcriptional regulator GlxA family with amidase domain